MGVKFEGNLSKVGRYWAVGIPALDIYTQGKSKRDAIVMIKEAVELMIDREGFAVMVGVLQENRLVLCAIRAEDDRYLLALMLKNQRARYGLSISQVAARLGISKNAYAQYEQARAVPSITKIEMFIHAMNTHSHVVLDLLEEALVA